MQITLAGAGGGSPQHSQKTHQSPANILRSRPFRQSSLTADNVPQPWSVSQPVKEQFDAGRPG